MTPVGEPSRRVLPVHPTALLAAVAVDAVGSPAGAVVWLSKTVLDLGGHLKDTAAADERLRRSSGGEKFYGD